MSANFLEAFSSSSVDVLVSDLASLASGDVEPFLAHSSPVHAVVLACAGVVGIYVGRFLSVSLPHARNTFR